MHRILSLEKGQQSSVTEARNAERAAARQREQRLIKERDAANDRASNQEENSGVTGLHWLLDPFNQ